MAFDFSTLVTDRTQQDVAYAKQLVDKLVTGTATDAEKAEWNSFTLKGAYNHTDLNRVTAAMEDLKARLEGYGYAVTNYKRLEVLHASQDVLPKGYIKLAYVESTGTQYIDFNFNTKPTTKFVADVEYTSFYGDDFDWFIGNRQEAVNWLAGYYGGQACYWSNGYCYAGALTTNQRTTLTVDFSGHVFSSSAGSSVSISAISPSTFPARLFIGNSATFSKSPKCKCYSVIVVEGGVKVCNLVPCISPSGEVGLYDIVTKKFYRNQGTGAFVAGDLVEVTQELESKYDPYLWYEVDYPTESTMAMYLSNVEAIRSVLAVMETTPDTPSDMVDLMVQEANDIEVILLDVYRQLAIMATTFIPCGEALSGGDNL